MDGSRPRLFIPRNDVSRIELEHGSGAERPIVSFVIAAALAVVSLLPLAMLVNAFRGAGAFPDKLIAGVALIIPAIWLLDLSLRRRWFLRVYLRRGSRKLLFARRADPQAIETFLSDARSRFGY